MKFSWLSHVAPHTGAWIETDVIFAYINNDQVAPHTGAWIETPCLNNHNRIDIVAPHTGAWIETLNGCHELLFGGRTPHGCVD